MEAYLDELVENGYNTIYFWNAHPFPYFVELPAIPRRATSAKRISGTISSN